MRVTKLRKEARIPTRKFPSDAGIDLYTDSGYKINIGEVMKLSTGVAIELPIHTMGLVMAKSRSNFVVGAGIVDQNYRGELKVKIFNPTNELISIEQGDAIAQLIVVPILTPLIQEVAYEDFTKETTDRGTSGGIHETN